MKRIGLIWLSLMMAVSLCAAPKSRKAKTRIRAWRLPEYTALADTQRVDTSFINMPMRNMLDDYSVSNSWNGNLVSPIQSRLYFKRLNKIDDIFGKQYQPFIITPQDVLFYNTTVPYSKISYQHGFTQYHEEHDLEFMFTGNFSKRLNVGVTANYLDAAGHYTNQEGKLFNGSVFGSYNGNKYSLHAAFTWNSLKNFENGGIQNQSDLKGTLEPEEIPVNMKGMSEYTYLSGLLHHYYSITTQRSHTDTIQVRTESGGWENKDTVIIDYIPVITFAHTFETNASIRRYIEQEPNPYFLDTYRNAYGTQDTSFVLTIKNTFSATFEEEFNKVLRFGFTVYARNECQRFTYGINEVYDPVSQWTAPPTFDQILEAGTYVGSDKKTAQQWTNNTFVGGAIYKKNGKLFRFDVNGDVCVLGYKLGQFDVKGKMDFDFRIAKDTLALNIHAQVKNDKPSYYFTNYYSNHYWWNEDYKSVFRFNVGGTVAYPTKWIKPALDVNFENITNYIYFGADGNPLQHDGNVQIFSADLHLDITTPWVNLENNVIYQYASKQIPLPALILYHNLYYHGTWFKALDTQIGVNMKYFTRYYSPILNPATGQFCVQDQVKIGNYPVLDVYASFYVRLLHLKFYVKYSHFNHLFMGTNTNYLAMPYYPINPDVFSLGVSWHFWR